MSDDQDLHVRLHRARRLVHSVEFHVFFAAVRELALIAGEVASRSLEPMTPATKAIIEAEPLKDAAAKLARGYGWLKP